MSAPELDDKTLALLLTISDLCGESDSPKTIVAAYERSVARVRKYRQEEATPVQHLTHSRYNRD
jgi:hypothetical protein